MKVSGFAGHVVMVLITQGWWVFIIAAYFSFQWTWAHANLAAAWLHRKERDKHEAKLSDRDKSEIRSILSRYKTVSGSQDARLDHIEELMKE